jgi:hypothetical protein
MGLTMQGLMKCGAATSEPGLTAALSATETSVLMWPASLAQCGLPATTASATDVSGALFVAHSA